MKSILVIETNKFIIPHFVQMGSFCTGKVLENNSDKGWLSLNCWAGEEESADYYENVRYMFPNIGKCILNHEICTPFIPLVSNCFFSNGYGDVFSISESINDVREKTQRSIAESFRRKIILAKKLKQGRKIFKQIKRKKREEYSKKVKHYPAFTNLGILWKDNPTQNEQEVILERAKIFASEKNFEILNMFLLDFNPEYVNLLHKTL